MTFTPEFWKALEWVAVICGVISSVGSYRRAMWSWPWGLVYALLAGCLVWHLKLYADVALQAFYFVSGIVGWWMWAHGGPRGEKLPVTLLTTGQRIAAVASCLLVTAVAGRLLSLHTDAAHPYWDSLATASAVTAALLCMRKKVECWTAWSVSTVLATGLFFSREAYPMAGISAAYFVFNCFAHRAWMRQFRRDQSGGRIAGDDAKAALAVVPG